MGSSLMRAIMMLWLWLSLLLLSSTTFASCSNHVNDWLVDAAMHDYTFSFSSRYHRGYGLSNHKSKQQRGNQQQGERRRRPQLPWLLQHSFGDKEDVMSTSTPTHNNERKNVIIPWKITTASLLRLRGGNSNKSEVGTTANERRSSKPKKDNSAKNKTKNKRNDKSKTKNKRSSKNKKKQNSDDDDDGDEDKDNDELDPSQEEEKPSATSESQEKKEIEEKTPTSSLSSSFLSSTFRMNEMARYEASIESSSDEEGKEEIEDDIVEETTTIYTNDDDDDDDDDTKKKRRNKKGKNKSDQVKTKTTTNESDAEKMEISIVANDFSTNNSKAKKREQQQRSKRGVVADYGREKTTTMEEEGKDVNNLVGETEIDPTDQSNGQVGSNEDDNDDDDDLKKDNAATDESNPFWWVDVWTQQLSDPEDIEDVEENYSDVDVDVNTIVDDIVDVNDGKEMIEDDDSDNAKKSVKEGEKRKNKKKGEKDRGSSSIIENVKLPVNPDSNGTVSSDSDSDSTAMTDNNTTILSDEESTTSIDNNVTTTISESKPSPSYISSGAWVPIDNLITIGLASRFASLRLSRKMRSVRKLSARITGLHGVLSGKPSSSSLPLGLLNDTATGTATDFDFDSGSIYDKESMQDIQKRIAAIDKAREGVERAEAAADEKAKRRKKSFWGFNVKEDIDLYFDDEEEGDFSDEPQEPKIPQKSPQEIEEEFQRMERVREIDRLISEGQTRLADLICEKDVLQRRPNPLFDYTTTETIITTEAASNEQAVTDEKNQTETTTSEEAETDTSTTKVEIQASREMNFPPDDLVAEYLDMMMSTRRLTKMNHTHLWKESESAEDDDDEESIGDDLFTASADAHRLYQSSPSRSRKNGSSGKNGKKGGGGSWFLRQSIGSGPSLGEKIGQAAETAAYKAVTAALMSFLARTISSLHGINVLKHSDIRLVLEQSPDLPPVPKDGIIRGNHANYAEETIKTVMRRKTRRSKKRSSKHRFSDTSFVQQEAVTETLLSHVQISAPLLKLFPLSWQRALLGNIITLSCALISDFVDGLHFQILGHELTFAFRPITEVDMARHFQMAGGRFNQRRYKAAEFEAAIQATAEDLKEELKFLDSWHERALGSGVLRTQIANMIARIVLTLTDEILSGARMDLWSAQAGGPRMLAGLEHRIEGEEDS